MQQLILHKKLYRVKRIDETEYLPIVQERLEKINLFKKLRIEGCSIKVACEALKTPQSTLYRWKKKYNLNGLLGLENESTSPYKVRQPRKSQQIINNIVALRKKNPLYGKAKITVLLKRDYSIIISESTVGRIISKLIKDDKVKLAYFYYAKKRLRPRVFKNHAQRWKFDMKAHEPGELLQIDHMSIPLASGFSIKHFQAICPVTKMVVEEAYSRASSLTASHFLEYIRTQLPFKVKSIQVDGGSEFMKDFELACKRLGIPLYVLPPRSPKYNGAVERANGSAKFEFYFFYDGLLNLVHLRKALQSYVHKYNKYRPHQALQYLTPLQYFLSLSEASTFSHIC
jgi:putative transposase